MKHNLNSRKTMAWIIAGSTAMLLQSCSIPGITTKQADTSLPTHFEKTEPAGTESTGNSAAVNWKDFFDDQNLITLIDTAVANNKEVNMMAQRISVAQNEIQARRGEYLPFVGIGASADKEKVGKYTRNGAVEENLDIKEGRSNPRFLGNYQFGLTASWELDVWKKLRNATKVAVTEYMASIEGKNFLVTNLVAEVAHAYYELVALDNELETLDQNIKIQQNA
ncbi:MAG TPA: TolC family protein, partial [Methylophilus sp.]|nr:TolC family protein [Methylophilus sp.]